MDVRERYHRDPLFRALTDQMYALVVAAKVTPTEVREAAMLAQIMYEELHPRPIYAWNRPVGDVTREMLER